MNASHPVDRQLGHLIAGYYDRCGITPSEIAGRLYERLRGYYAFVEETPKSIERHLADLAKGNYLGTGSLEEEVTKACAEQRTLFLLHMLGLHAHHPIITELRSLLPNIEYPPQGAPNYNILPCRKQPEVRHIFRGDNQTRQIEDDLYQIDGSDDIDQRTEYDE